MSLIFDRPQSLEKIKFYSTLPLSGFYLDLASSIDNFLLEDIKFLNGIQPIEGRYVDKVGSLLTVQPSDILLKLYEKNNITFQLINVVINLFAFAKGNDIVSGKPYSITLVPCSKRNKIEEISPIVFRTLNLNDLHQQGWVYMGLNPFNEGYDSFGKLIDFINNKPYKIYTDMIGFIYNTYALASQIDNKDILLPEVKSCNPFLLKKLIKYRVSRYYKRFNNLKPRKVWGCDSPIELFLLYALEYEGLKPQIQTTVYGDGTTYSTLYEMIADNKHVSNIDIISEVDFYFPREKVAVFCDSGAYHRSLSSKAKDTRIDQKLKNIGIRSLRLKGNEIVKDPFFCAEMVKHELE
jgi:hypothetical protein